jgi:hypothetical protein
MSTEILITSPPDRKQTVAEIWFDNVQLAELNDETGHPVLEVYPRPDGGPWILDFDELIDLLQRARTRLLNGSGRTAK